MDPQQLLDGTSESSRSRLPQRLLGVGIGVLLFMAIASVIRPQDSSASQEKGRWQAANLTAGGGGRLGVVEGTASTGAHVLSRMETGGHAAPAHPRGLRPLGALLGREYMVWMYAEADGARFTVCRRDGDMVAEDLTADDVYQRFPELDFKNLGVPGDGEALMMAPEE